MSPTPSRRQGGGRPAVNKQGLSYKECIGHVSAMLGNYAERGVFRSFSGGQVSRASARFKMIWHRDRQFDLTFDVTRNTLRFAVVLPQVPPYSPMYEAFKEFLESRHDDVLPPHRRIDRAKARVNCANRGGNVSLALTVLDGDYDYGVRKLIHLVHEIYLVFLVDGPYLEYMIAAFQLDPDRI